MAAKVSSHSAGSWFPTGYYGHYRSRARPDFVNEYRQLAKPQPPQRFLHRSSQPSSAHPFSRHDNRHSFMDDASYFAQGLGRKRHPQRSGVFDPDFFAWSPDKHNPNVGRPLTSTYRKDYKLDEPATVQLLVKRPNTSFDGRITTMYRSVHGRDSPNREFINAMNNEALMLSLHSRQRQAKMKRSDRRETVASCMTWYRPRVPEATCHTDYNHIDIRPPQQAEMNFTNLTLPHVQPAAVKPCTDVAAAEPISAPVQAVCE